MDENVNVEQQVVEETEKLDFEGVLKKYDLVGEFDRRISKAINTREKAFEEEKTKLLADKEKDILSLQDALKNSENIEQTFSEFKAQHEQEVANLKQQQQQQCVDFAIQDRMRDLKFSSNSAKNDFYRQVKESNLVLQNGTLIGFDDLVSMCKQNDPQAFINETVDNNTEKVAPVFVAEAKAPSLDTSLADMFNFPTRC